MNLAALCFLVVEDDEFQREALLIILEELNARLIHSADDGASGLKAFVGSSPPVDIIITDLNMPGMDGIEFIRHVGESGRPVSVVLASAVDPSVMASVVNVADAYGIDVLGVLQKPITTETLGGVLELYQAPEQQPDAVTAAEQNCYGVDDVVKGLHNDEFEPFFQPKVELTTGRISGFEALARWRRPHQDVVLPAEFLPLMEAHGLIDSLTWTMLRKSAAACRTWRASGQDYCVAVNIAMGSLGDLQFADRLSSIVREEGVDPRSIILEVTEAEAERSEWGCVLGNLSRLRLKGFGLSIDDYGTGYSSLQRLSHIAFTELKVDQSFVREAARSEATMAILQSGIDTARKLKIVSVAEGIETPQEWALLLACGCDLAQGYLIARPMQAHEVLPWSGRWREHFELLTSAPAQA